MNRLVFQRRNKLKLLFTFFERTITIDIKIKGGKMSLVIRDASGWATHRIERSANGVDLVVRNLSTGWVEERITDGVLR